VASLNVDDTRAWYSSYGPAVDISAPGGGFEGGILSTLPGNTYGLMSGTSMSSPLIAGCLGYLKSYHPEWTSDQVVEQLIGTADNIDSLNADFLYLLGSGRVNAYRFLTETNVSAPQEFKLELVEFTPLDENGNQVCEAGEEVILNLVLRNFTHHVGEEDVLATITTDDQDIVILQDSAVVDIIPDDNFAIENQFVVKIDSNATSKFSEFTMHFGSSIPVVYGQDLTFHLLVAPSGIFIFEGNVPDQEYSGTCIAEVLDHLGMDYTFYNDYPATLLGFETVFLSHGNFGSTLANGHMYTEAHSLLVQEFLEAGGNLYIDMGGMFAGSAYFGYSNLVEMMGLFGVTNMAPPAGQDPVDSLFGSPGNIFEEIVFTGSEQPLSWYIDDLQIDETVASVPFQEKNKGNVSVMREDTVDHDYRAMYFGYSLGELIDRDAVNSRKNVILELLEFFNYELPEGYVLANFLNDKAGGGIPLEVNFSDISITHPDYMISSWAWDFDSDGTIDSYDQNPTWTYNDLGTFDVTLIVSNGQSTDTLVREELIRINFGYLVYDGAPGELGYSGSFLKDYFEENGSHVTYLEEFPEVLDGFTAVFLCFGNFGYNNTVFDDRKADIVSDYLENSGYVYLEGGDVLGFDQAADGDLLAMFGLVSSDDGGFNEIDSLGGHPDALTSGMLFTSSNQLSNAYIDTYEPDEDAQVAFIESNYGNVAVQYEGDKDQRTFCFSYSLGDLDDGEFPNTREELLRRICEFFDIYTTIAEDKEDELHSCVYPNPVYHSCKIEYTIAKECQVSIEVFDIEGRKVATLVDCQQSAGEHRAAFDASALPAGIYFYRIVTETGFGGGKFLVVK
jgi:hypothetical protein